VDLAPTWFFHAPVPPGTTRGGLDVRRELYAAVGAEFDVAIEHEGFWELRIAYADQYRQGRVFIAGDAAHSHPPYGGYGVNTGFEDAKNLGWKLAAVLDGWGGERLLDTYDEERRPVFASTASDFIERAIEQDRHFLERFDPQRDRDAFEREWEARRTGATADVGAFEPHYESSSIVCGPPGGRCSALGAHSFVARAGHHLAPASLSSGRNVYEELGANFTLLGLAANEPALEAFTSAARRLRIPLTVIRDDCAEARDLYGSRLVLVRPDQFVAWTSPGPDVDAATVFRSVTGAR